MPAYCWRISVNKRGAGINAFFLSVGHLSFEQVRFFSAVKGKKMTECVAALARVFAQCVACCCPGRDSDREQTPNATHVHSHSPQRDNLENFEEQRAREKIELGQLQTDNCQSVASESDDRKMDAQIGDDEDEASGTAISKLFEQMQKEITASLEHLDAAGRD